MVKLGIYTNGLRLIEADLMTDNLPNQYRPKKFSDYVGQKQYVQSIKDLIANNRHHLAKCIWLTGPSGTGKSSLALLYARATLCVNRGEGEYEPCGRCNICLGVDESDIHHYTITNTTEARASIRELASISKQSPTLRKGLRPDQYRRFIIIDEAELASAELIAELLDSTESSPSSTTWIIISMDPQKLEKRDPVILEAIQSRCVEFPLCSLPEEEIARNIVDKINISEEAATTVAELSGGNMRMALNLVGLLLVSYQKEDITSDLVVKYKVGNFSMGDVPILWSALEKSQASKVNSILSNWESCVNDKSILANILLKNLLEQISATTDEGKELIKSISCWSSSRNRYPISAAISPFMGKGLFKKNESSDLARPKKSLYMACISNGQNPFSIIKSIEDLVTLY